MLRDHVALHVGVRLGELADLQKLPGHRGGDQIGDHVPEKPAVAHEDDDGERHDREEQHLVVREPQAEHERRDPQDFVRRTAHPAVGQQKDRHQEERVQRIDLDDRRLGPLDRRKRERQRAAHAAAERENPRLQIPFFARFGDEIVRAAADEHGGEARRQRTRRGREKADRPSRRRVPHVRHPGEHLAEEPAAERPERIARRMRHAEMRARRGEFARVLESHGRA